MAAGGGMSELLMLGVVVIGGYFAWKEGIFDKVFSELKGAVGNLPALPALPSLGGAGGGGGGISSSGTCVGTALQPDHQGSSKRWESGNIPGNPSAYEVTWCGKFSGDDLTFKMYGPSHHSSGDCCWCVMHVTPSGAMVPGGEGPHPSSNCEHKEGSKGSAKAECYKAVIRPGPVQEGYALVGGQWKLLASYKGPCGCSKKSPHLKQEIL